MRTFGCYPFSPLGMFMLGVLLFFLPPVRAELLLERDTGGESLSPHLMILRDPSGSMTVPQVLAAFRDGQTETLRRAWPQFGFTPDTIWVRFALRSALDESGDWLIELRTSRMGELDWYEFRADGAIRQLQAGNQRPRNPALLSHKYPVFPVRLAAGETVEVLLRVRAEASLHIPLRAWSPAHYAEDQARGASVFTTFFGYMAALVLLALMFSFFTRDHGYAIYSLSLLALMTNYGITTGYYAWLGLPAIPWVSHMGTLLAAEIAMLLLLAYFRYLFDLNGTSSRLDRWGVLPLIGLTLLLAVLSGILPYRIAVQLMLLHALLIGAFSMTAATFFWLRGNRTARFYVIGWLSFWVLFASNVLQMHGILPMPTLPELPALISIAASMTFFFLAMADRVRDIHRRADEAGAQILSLEREVTRGLQDQARQQQLLIRDLHDGIGGLMANLGILAEIGRRATDEEKARNYLDRIGGLAAEGAAEVQGLMNSLETKTLTWPDIIVECRRQGDMRLAAHGITFDLQTEGDPGTGSPGLRPGLALLRIFKEALTNVVKHAGAGKVDVVLQFEPARFRMILRDDGQGIGSGSAKGRGLANMDARINEWGGRMEVRDSAPGTVLVFDLPLPVKSPEPGIPVPTPTV